MKKNQLESNQFTQSSPEMHLSDFKPYKSASYIRALAFIFIVAASICALVLLLFLVRVFQPDPVSVPILIYVCVGGFTIAAFMLIVANMSFDIQFLAYTLEEMEEQNKNNQAFILNHLQQIESELQTIQPRKKEEKKEEKKEQRYFDL